MKNFNDIYADVLKNEKKQIEEYRKKVLRKFNLVNLISALCAIGGLIIWITFSVNAEIIQTICVPIMIYLIVYWKIESYWFNSEEKKKYIALYKENVVKKTIEAYNENLNYYYNIGITKDIYQQSGFEKYDNIIDLYNFDSEDMIEGAVDDHEILMSEVYLSEYSREENNKKYKNIGMFKGIFACVDINNKYNEDIYICSDKGKLSKIFREKKRIEMDSSEFEKYFDVYSEDKIQVMRMLTSDIMEEMINFIKSNKIKFEMIINNNTLYIRYYMGEMFEPNIFRSSVNYNSLKKVYDVVAFTFGITGKFIKVSEKNEI